MSNPLPGPPIRDGGIPFSWFNWFRKLYRSFTELYDYTYTLPTTSGGKLKTQLLTIADSSPWTWPDGVDGVWVTMVGGGAGGRGNDTGSLGGGGGGSGEYCVRRWYPRLSATTTTFTVGAKGAADSDGSNTTFGTITVQSGKTPTTVGYGGRGGGIQTEPSSKVVGVRSIDEGVVTFSGANGGGAGSTTASAGFAGGGCEHYTGGLGGSSNGSRSGGGGGGASPFGNGGDGGSAVGPGNAPAATAYGAGGGGAGGTGTSAAGAPGQDGCILLEWVE